MDTTTKMALFVWAFLMLVALETACAFYDPGTQRWLNRDPIEERGGGNLYQFVQNDPLTYRDGFGLQSGGVISNPSVCQVGTATGATLATALASIPAGATVVGTAVIGTAVLITYSICHPPVARPPFSATYCPARGRVNAPPVAISRPYIPPISKPPEREWCPLEDQHDMGPVAGYRCEYWCRKSGAKPVTYVPHSEGGCPKYFLKE